jgi:hypothetical protein
MVYNDYSLVSATAAVGCGRIDMPRRTSRAVMTNSGSKNKKYKKVIH